MHKNYRRKNPRSGRRKSWMRKAKQFVLNQRSRKRRRGDKRLIHDRKWDEIRRFEKPVDWWAID